MTTYDTTEDWTSAWPDALAFAFGLAMAWWEKWTTTDLVWSLWLSSLVVGYATILWTILRPAIFLARGNWRTGTMTVRVESGPTKTTSALLAVPFLVLGGLFLLAFFTVHFGFFHYIHSQFLGTFFPINPGTGGRHTSVDMSTYAEVLRRYWLFLPAAFLAERAGFQKPERTEGRPPEDLSLSRAERMARLMGDSPEAARARKGAGGNAFGNGMTAPYRNVIRMHLLIFFFGFAHAAGLDNFSVYAVVYAVYFFPWRLVRRANSPQPA